MKKGLILLFIAIVLTFSVALASGAWAPGPAKGLGPGGFEAAEDRFEEAIAGGLSVRSDLTCGEGPFMTGQPIIMEAAGWSALGGSEENSLVLSIGNVSGNGSKVWSLRADGPLVPWSSEGDGGTVRFVLREPLPSEILVVVIDTPGNFVLDLAAEDITGRSEGRPATAMIEVQEQAYLFEAPTALSRPEGPWPAIVENDTGFNFSVNASTTPNWHDEPWSSYYNWTVTVINLQGMVVGGDLSRYNTGEHGLDTHVLDSTSVVSAWDSGYNTVFYTIWDQPRGARLSGDAAMTPTGKELTYASAAYAAWENGSWTPQGGGSITFHQTGKYLFVISLTEGGRAVSPPVMLETRVV